MADLDPRTALAYAKRMKDYCDAFNGRDWANAMIHGSPDEQNLAHALDNLTECAAMLMNMAERVAAADGVMVDAPSATQAALRYRVKGAPDGKWHYEDHPELMRRIIATREEGEGGGYLYEVEPLAVIPSGVGIPRPSETMPQLSDSQREAVKNLRDHLDALTAIVEDRRRPKGERHYQDGALDLQAGFCREWLNSLEGEDVRKLIDAHGVTTCPACNGTGDHAWEGKCETCGGTGRIAGVLEVDRG